MSARYHGRAGARPREGSSAILAYTMVGVSDWWLVLPGEKRLRVTAGGILFGRSAQCDVVLTDARASRAHAIVCAGPRSPRITVLGQGNTAVNGEPLDRDRDLMPGDHIDVPGLSLGVVAEPRQG